MDDARIYLIANAFIGKYSTVKLTFVVFLQNYV